MDRRRLIALIHTGAKALGMDEACRRAWMVKHTGKDRCTACNDVELSRLGDELRAMGFQPARTRNYGGTGPNRPTDKQRGYADRLAREKGFTGLDDPGLATLCRRVAKVDSPRFLDKDGMRALILALERWIEWGKTHPAKAK